MKLSIIIPYYNAEKYIEACISSCEQFHSFDVEIIAINDGSTDKSEMIVKNHPGVKSYEQEHKGVSAARNYGLSVAKGDYIWFVDADDLINPDALKHVLERCDGFLNIVRFNHYRYYKATDKLMKRFEQPPYWIWFHERQFLWEVVWDRIYRRKFLEEHNLKFDEKINFGEDQIFNLECLFYNHGYAQDSKFAYVKTWNNPHSITHHLDTKMRQENLDALRRLKQKYKDYKQMKDEIDFQIFKLKQLPSFKGYK